MVPSSAIILVAFLGVFHIAAPWSSDYATAVATARDSGRPLVVVMENPSDSQGRAEGLFQIESDLLTQFQVCRVDATSRYGKKIADLYGAKEFPYVVITDPDCREVLFRGVGTFAKATIAETLRVHAPISAEVVQATDSAKLPTTTFAETDAFGHLDFQSAETASKQSKRPLLVAVSMDACHFCDKLKAETFSDQHLREKIARQFESVMIMDADHSQWVEEHHVSIFPTILIVDVNGRLLDRVEGFVRPRQLESRLDQISTQRLSSR